MKQDRLPALDGLRGLSVLIVACGHLLEAVGAKHVNGSIGVTVFFFISGFIITKILLQEMVDSGTIRLKAFYIRRWFRLSPALVVYVALAALALAMLGKFMPARDAIPVLLYYGNYYNILHGFELYGTPQIPMILSPLITTWSLAVEEHFYLLFPLVLLLFRRQGGRLLLALLVFVLGMTAWRFHLASSGVGDAMGRHMRLYESSDTRLDSIAYGCMLSLVMHRASLGGSAEKLFLNALRGYRGVAVAALIFMASVIPRSQEFKDTFVFTLQGMSLAALFCALFWQGHASFVRKLFEWRPLVYVGTVSYSLYLYHYLGYVIAQLLTSNPLKIMLIAWPLTIVGTVLSFYCVETPLRKFGARLAKRERNLSKGVEALQRNG